MGIVANEGSHVIDLDDGRLLEPGATAEADTNHPHQRALILDGILAVREGLKPRTRQDDRLVSRAASQPSAEADLDHPKETTG